MSGWYIQVQLYFDLFLEYGRVPKLDNENLVLLLAKSFVTGWYFVDNVARISDKCYSFLQPHKIAVTVSIPYSSEKQFLLWKMLLMHLFLLYSLYRKNKLMMMMLNEGVAVGYLQYMYIYSKPQHSKVYRKY